MGREINLDIGVLRSFLLIADGRSFAETAELVGRSPSAVSLQIQRLEADLGAPVFRRNNREVALTLAGERLLGFARRIVRSNDEAVLAFRPGQDSRGPLRFGATQDFAEAVLPEVLGRFADDHPKVELTLQIDRSAKLIDAVQEGAIDVAIAIRRDHPLNRGTLTEIPMIWIGREGLALDPDEPVPLVMFDPPCSFRSAAIDGLAAADRGHRVAFTSPSLSGLRMAVEAGLGVTVRTRHLLAPRLDDVAHLGLPALPSVAFSLYVADENSPWAARDDLVTLCRRRFQA
ncbi:LysR substrate-binding domain-containing protein [Microvirga aerophila]|uniref:LysR family transcriptional regulator n=1 Tax=Microvirga aerophila TaxID=670291 RepID=A0A512BL58_9HYPH|nr:LysR substrate-binding domain-containing protein [Microvirga aerophila]GEO12706.1 LysR family transcriptional regulator [Microvirga aerophila]